ncbi:MAG TPA: LacI family DNA-binding transcriptional regulator [Fimbriimonas sp.]|nr:LacI family DNA-binding transcriptional regulator [Fimbriimonas sp.]
MAVTIREVAKEAGVSAAAVSKVLHGRGSSIRVGVTSAQRIRDAALKLNYFPNAVARNLRSSRTGTIGVIFENLVSFADGPLYSMYLLDGLAKAVFPNHYRLTILPELDHDNILGSIADGQIEGVIWCKLARDEATLQLIHDCPIPIVALNARSPEEPSEAVFVGCENEGGIAQAIDHLVALGHQRIAFLSETVEGDTPDCEARREGFRARMAFHGLPTSRDDELQWTWYIPEFTDWWASHPAHTAIVCWSERCAAALLKKASDVGVDVPSELSVVGFDSTPYCEMVRPRLTSVRQPITEMAKLAGEILLAMLNGERPESSSFVLPCEFDVRDSTAAPRIA